MEGNRGQASFRNQLQTNTSSPYSRSTADLPYLFTGRNPEVQKRTIHNPNDSPRGWVPDSRSNRILTSLENNYPLPARSGFFKEFHESRENKPGCSAPQSKFPTVGSFSFTEVDLINQQNEEKRGTSKRKAEPKYFDTKKKQTADDIQTRRREYQFKILTGPVEKVLYWFKLKNHIHLLFEVFAMLIDVRKGSHPTEKNLILRDERNGPSLMVIYYEMDRPLPILTVGKIVRCVGTLKSRNILQAFKIEESSEEEKCQSQRLFFISNMAAEEALSLFQKK